MAEGRLAVVGAGLSGLSSALALKSLGHRVDLYERSRLLGGKATSFEVDGIEVDSGQHVFLACCHQFIDFVRGLEPTPAATDSLLYLQPRFEALLLSKTAAPVRMRSLRLPAPFHLAGALIGSRQLGLLGRLQVALAFLALRAGELPGESFLDWLRRHGQGGRAIRGFWDPFLVPALNAEMGEVSAKDAAFVVRTAFLEQADAARFGYTRIPLGRIAGLAADRLDEVHLRTSVTAIESSKTAAGPVLVTLQDGEKRAYDGVVLACPPDRLKTILASPKQFGVYGLDQFRHVPIVDVHLWFDLPPGTVFGSSGDFAAIIDSPIQWVFEKPAPPGETYLCCSMSSAAKYVSTPKQQLIDFAHAELNMVLPAIRGARLLRGAATRDREATFLTSVGLFRPGAPTSDPRVTIAGAWTDTGWPATMESAVRSGRTAAGVLHGAIAA